MELTVMTGAKLGFGLALGGAAFTAVVVAVAVVILLVASIVSN